jgi:hypothetical protein
MHIQIHVKKKLNIFHTVNKTREAAVKASYALSSLIASYTIPVFKNALLKLLRLFSMKKWSIQKIKH